MTKQLLKNHVAILLDTSGSMYNIIGDMQKVLQQRIEFLRKMSLDFNQETRISIYTFDDKPECVVYDTDVTRPIDLGKFKASGSTALLDCLNQAVCELELLPEIHGDHAYIVYILSDGGENCSRATNAKAMLQKIKSLKENWTIAGYVPNMDAGKYLESYGIPKGNIERWDADKKGIAEVEDTFDRSMTQYYSSRQSGVRSSQTIFSGLKDVNSTNVTKVLDELDKKDFTIVINEDVKALWIRDIVESKTSLNYIRGNSYYELVKNEHVQPNKNIIIQNKKTGKAYSGVNARQLLGLPSNMEVKLSVGDYGEWLVYVQSNSHNRNVIPKQRILVMK
jgi:hypothetical protein